MAWRPPHSHRKLSPASRVGHGAWGSLCAALALPGSPREHHQGLLVSLGWAVLGLTYVGAAGLLPNRRNLGSWRSDRALLLCLRVLPAWGRRLCVRLLTPPPETLQVCPRGCASVVLCCVGRGHTQQCSVSPWHCAGAAAVLRVRLVSSPRAGASVPLPIHTWGHWGSAVSTVSAYGHGDRALPGSKCPPPFLPHPTAIGHPPQVLLKPVSVQASVAVAPPSCPPARPPMPTYCRSSCSAEVTRSRSDTL